MYWISRTTAAVTMVAVVFHCSLSTLAVTDATIEGTVAVPCDPSRVSEIASVQIRPVSGEPAATVDVDSSTGKFHSAGLTEGEYEVIVSMQPPGCGEQDSDLDGIPDTVDSCPNSPPGTAVGIDGCPSQDGKKSGKKDGLKDWHLTLIYVGVVGAIILALDDDDRERQGSPSQP